MTVKIGKDVYPIHHPEDLDQRLLDATGGSVAEMREAVAKTPLPRIMATALHPFLKDGPSKAELAQSIAAVGVEEIRPQVMALYAPKEAEKPKAPDAK